MRADVIREHAISPKWRLHPETAQYFDVDVHVFARVNVQLNIAIICQCGTITYETHVKNYRSELTWISGLKGPDLFLNQVYPAGN